MASISDRAIILHIKPYRETSVIISLLSEGNGLVRGVLKGQRGIGTAHKKKAALQDISLINFSFMGRSELKTITMIEPIRQYKIKSSTLTYSLLLTELCYKLLPAGQEEGMLFDLLDQSLNALVDSQTNPDEVAINFIIKFLDSQGYDLWSDESSAVLSTEGHEQGFVTMPHAQVLHYLQKEIHRCYPSRSINSFKYITRNTHEAWG
jgi:DNA repair protein RecO (recombination protein O)